MQLAFDDHKAAFTLGERNIGQCRHHEDAEKHGNRLNPQKLVPEECAGHHRGRRTACAKRHSALHPGRTGHLEITPDAFAKRLLVQITEVFFLQTDLFRIPFTGHRKAAVFLFFAHP